MNTSPPTETVSNERAAIILEGIAERHTEMDDQERGHLKDAAWALRETTARLLQAEANLDAFLMRPSPEPALPQTDDVRVVCDDLREHGFPAYATLIGSLQAHIIALESRRAPEPDGKPDGWLLVSKQGRDLFHTEEVARRFDGDVFPLYRNLSKAGAP